MPDCSLQRGQDRVSGESVQSGTQSAGDERSASGGRPSLDVVQNKVPQSQNGEGERSEPSTGEYESCPNPIPIQRTDTETGEVEAIEKPCGRRTCPYCREWRRKGEIAHYIEEYKDRDNLRFITLTLDPKAFPDNLPGECEGIDPTDFGESRKYLLHIWKRRFVKRIKRRTEGSLTYTASVEKHDSGQAHLHAIMSTDVPEETIRKHWFEAGGGVVAEVCDIDSDDEDELAAQVGYVLKYVFEEAERHVKGRNAVVNSNGVGYDSGAAKAKRRRHVEEEGEKEDSDRYEYRGPSGGGKPDNGDTVTPADIARFEHIREHARSSKYVKWEDTDFPRDGKRWEYDRDTGEVTSTQVTEHRRNDGTRGIMEKPIQEPEPGG